MTYQASWTISGTKIEDSANALINVSQSVTNTQNLKKYEKTLNDKFQSYIRKNLRRSGLDSNSFNNVFFLKIYNGKINFINTEPLITSRYEYGYNDDNSNDDEYDEAYILQTSPRYFIRPAIQESLNDIRDVIIEEANKSYMESRRQTYGDEINER